MRLALALIIAGLTLTVLGFAILFGSLEGVIPFGASFLGFAMIVVGPLAIFGGLVAYALRRPTRKELASQNVRDYRSWHFRPVGLLILGIVLAGACLLGNWVEEQVPAIKDALNWITRSILRIKPQPYPVAGYIFGIVCLLSLSFRKIRNLIFYTGEMRHARIAEKTGAQKTAQRVSEPDVRNRPD